METSRKTSPRPSSRPSLLYGRRRWSCWTIRESWTNFSKPARRRRAKRPVQPCTACGPRWASTSGGDQGEDPQSARRHTPRGPLLHDRLAPAPGRQKAGDPSLLRGARGRGEEKDGEGGPPEKATL